MAVRKVKADDLEEILILYQHLFKSEDYSDMKIFKDKWKEILNYNGLTYFVCTENEKIVASCNVSITPNLSRGQRAYALIENVITHPEYRRKGYGKAVVEKAIDFVKSENCYKTSYLILCVKTILTYSAPYPYLQNESFPLYW